MGVLCLLATAVSATNFAVIESQSFHIFHSMDGKWKSAINGMNHDADILAQTALENITNLENYDVLVISSGLIDLNDTQKATINAFAASGRHVYIQSEFLLDHPGNLAFKNAVNNLGGNFEWLGYETGNIAPLEVTAPFNNNVNTVNEMTYYWYGTYGTGDATVEAFIKNTNNEYGFVFTAPNQNYGKIVTTSDQDWIRTGNNIELLENIIDYLATPLVVAATPTVAIEHTNPNDCEGNAYEFTATIADHTPEVILEWTVNGQPIAGANQTTFITNTIVEGDVVECVLYLTNNPEYSHVSNPVLIASVVPLAEVNIEISTETTNVCEGTEVTFIATGDNWGTAPEFQWSIDNINIDNNTATFTTVIDNNQIIRCKILSDADCTVDATAVSNTVSMITMPAVTPTVTINSDASSICEGEAITFTATGNNWGIDYDLVWKIDGQNTNNQSLIFSTDELQPNQVVTCEVISHRECLTNDVAVSNAIALTIEPLMTPTITLSSNMETACIGEEVEMTAEGINWGETPTFIWKINNQTIETTTTPVLQYTQTANNSAVTCELVSSLPCVTQNNIEAAPINVLSITDALPTVAIIADQTNICDGATVSFSANGDNWNNTPNINWMIDGEVVANNTDIFSTNELTPGQIVTCALTMNMDCNGQITVASNEIVLNSGNLNINLEELENEYCNQTNGFAEISINGGVEPYQINWNNGLTETIATDLAAGIYEIEAVDANGCSAFIQFEIDNIEGPEILDLDIKNATCAGTSGKAKVQMLDITKSYTYLWLTEENFIISRADSLTDARPGTYTLVVQTEGGCETVQEIQIEESLNFEAAISTKDEIVLGEKIILNLDVVSSSTFTIQWKDSTLLSCTDCFQPEVTPTENKMFTAVITTVEGCTFEVTKYVVIKPAKNIFIPNAFSPNNDGQNDFFMAYGNNAQVAGLTMQVFNRWGSKVFEGKDLNINNEIAGWNGHVNGKTLDAGVYIYVVEVNFIDGSTEMMTGDVTLVR